MDKTLPAVLKGEKKIYSPKDVFKSGLEFVWLGQSGFLFSVHGKQLLIDAYLTDYLEFNNPGLPFHHERMMESPFDDGILPSLDYILITHGHEDHLDPELMQKLARVNTKAEYLIPPGCRQALLSCGIRENQVRDVVYDTPTLINDHFSLNAFPAAHPEPEFKSEKTWALSYQLLVEGVSIFFAGDTTVYPRLLDWLKSKEFDLLILPVNGRDPDMEKKGIIGNMTFEEGIILSLMLDTPMLGTHFGMFAFNTVDPAELLGKIRNFGLEDRVLLTEPGVVYSIS